MAVGKGESECRLWIHVGSANDDSDDDDGFKGRKFTVELTDRVGSWQYVRKLTSANTLADMNIQTIQVMLEFLAYDVTTGHRYWPKDEALNEWKNHLRIGDVVDAEDECGDWYESEIFQVDMHCHSLQVHFKGWSHKFNVVISEAEFAKKIAPLYSITDNCRDSLEPYDKVDYTHRLNLKDGSKWLHAYVMKVDHAKGLLTVKYREENYQIYTTDDWIDINGEAICKAGTHVKTS
ncbi:unnamed protein product, partial [Symbiodinium microadriaticum]